MSRDARAPEHIRVGPAGWFSPDGEGRVSAIPKRRGSDPLAYLPQYVDTIESNSTGYRIPSIPMPRSWALRVSDHPDVRLPVKLWHGLTHEDQTSAEEGRGCAWMPISHRRLPTSVMS
jgi:uncharacterized protein YecE (DUF72 family)